MKKRTQNKLACKRVLKKKKNYSVWSRNCGEYDIYILEKIEKYVLRGQEAHDKGFCFYKLIYTQSLFLLSNTYLGQGGFYFRLKLSLLNKRL